MCLMSAMDSPVCASTAAPAALIAGEAANSARSVTCHSSVAYAPACVNTHFACGTPACAAAAALHMINPVAWLTCRLAVSSFGYGALIGRLPALGVASCSAVNRCGSQACGLFAATSLNCDHSRAMCVRCAC